MGKVRVLLDTNVVLDYFSGRMGDNLAATLIQIGRSSEFEMCISFLTAINTLYVAGKMGCDVKPSGIPVFFTILQQDSAQWQDACDLEMSDFEDATQASCALHNDCAIAISRDGHFNAAPMCVMTPQEFIDAVTVQ